MKKIILVSSEGGEIRVCLMISGKLVNIDAEGPTGGSIIGNIYKGRITGIARSLNACFVDIGEGKEGFLSIQDVHPAILESFGKRVSIGEVFERSQEILVQVLRDPVGDKGPMLTTCISLPGRYMVLIPAVERTGISKKLPDEERKRLRDILKEVEVPEGFGVIVRTAGESRPKQDLLRDVNRLIKGWGQIEKTFGQAPAPSMLVSDQDVAVRFMREYLANDVEQIVVDNEKQYREVLKFLSLVMPRFKKRVKLYTEPLPLFVRYNVENQIENMFLRDVPLPSGGQIVIDRTEALTAIDVNSGRTKSKNVEDTVTQANLEAADEIANQAILRDLGGLIVIDFIDMMDPNNRRKVQQRLKDSFKADKAKANFGRISQFGLLEMTRQRLRSGVVARFSTTCHHCLGLGYIRETSSSALHILRRLRELAVSGKPGLITVNAPVEVANFMQNSLRDLIYELEAEQGVKVNIIGDPGVYHEQIVAGRPEGDDETGDADEQPKKAEEKAKKEQPARKSRSRSRQKPADDKPAAEKAPAPKQKKQTGKGRGQQTRKAPEKQTEAASEKPARSRGGRSRQRRDRRPAAAEILTETPPPLPEPPPLPARTPEATPGIYTPRDEPTWDHPSSDAANSDGLLDSIIRKLLGIKR